MAAKFHLCLLLIILGTIAVQGARLRKPDLLPREVGSKWLLLRLYFKNVRAHCYCASLLRN